MAPKKKSKKKLEEELRRKEEEERLAEEERRRQEEEERIRREEEARIKAEFSEKHLKEEEERLTTEREKLSTFSQSITAERIQANARQLNGRDWERYVKCTPLPDPTKRNQLNDYLNYLREARCSELPMTLAICENALKVMCDCDDVRLDALQNNEQSSPEQHQQDMRDIQDLIEEKLRQQTAQIVQFCDDFANDRGEVQMGHRTEHFRFGMWFNIAKNPRLRMIDFSEIGITVEIPKQIALASVALLVHMHFYDEYFFSCTNEYMAIGDILHPQLVTLLPGCKNVKNWTIRTLVPPDQAVRGVSYPIPAAGADPMSFKSENLPPPITFTVPIKSHLLLGNKVDVGWWDEETKTWSREGISDVLCDKEGGVLTFQTAHLAPLSIVQNRAQLFPYQAWNIRPTGGKHADTAAFSIQISNGEWVEFEVSPGSIKLVQPQHKEISSLVGAPLPPRRLLHRLSRCGLNLLPEGRDAEFVRGVTAKDETVERLMCEDVALISRAFVVASNKWNRHIGSTECLCRISEVLDWEGAGRTEPKHVERIFSKERQEGERKVMSILRRGEKGIAYSPAFNNASEYQEVPGYDTQAYEETVFGEVHSSMVTLLEGTQGDLKDTDLGQKLKGSPEGIEQAKNTNPHYTQTMAQLLNALRIFSFG